MSAVLAITGGTGFVGQAVLETALSQGHTVRALTRREQEPRDGVHWVRGTLSDPDALEELVSGADAVIHIAGLTNTPDITEFETANVAGTQKVLNAADKARIKRLVLVSSLSAREPKLSAYGASKARAETLVEASKLDWTIVRPPAVYGPRDVDMFELFRSAKFGLVPLPPGGATSIIHVSDLAELLITLTVGAHRQAAIIKKTFEPDDGREGGWAHKEMAQAIGRAVGKKRVFAPHLPTGVLGLGARTDRLLRGDKAKLTADRVGYMCHPNWVARSHKSVPEAVWKPKIGGEEGFAATAQWYRDHGWL